MKTFPLIHLFIGTLLLASIARLGHGAKESAALQPEAPDSYSYLGLRLDGKIKDMEWGDGQLSVVVEDGEVPLKIYGQNENSMMQPAGLLQIVTAAAALDRLGPDFHFTTELSTSGHIEKGQLNGSLIVRGSGDPSLSTLFVRKPQDSWEVFDRWAKLLRKKGIKKISGSIIADDRAFDNQLQPPGWPLGELGTANLPSVGALNFNQNCIDIFWEKGRKAGRPAEYTIFPLLPKYVFLASSVHLAATPGGPRHYDRKKDSNVIAVNGELAIKTVAHDRASIQEPGRFFAEALKARLAERKILADGAAQAASTMAPGEFPKRLESIDTFASPPLATLLAQMMRYDLALNAEVALKAMGAKATGTSGSFTSGVREVEAFLDRLHLPGSRRVLMDGSGRSSLDRLTASQIVGLLRRMDKQATGKDFAALFPHAGEPGAAGILADRFRPIALQPAAKGKGKQKAKAEDNPALTATRIPDVWAKTGSAKGTEAIAGWVRTRAGGRLLFTFIVNGSKTPAEILRLQFDTLISDLAESGIEK